MKRLIGMTVLAVAVAAGAACGISFFPAGAAAAPNLQVISANVDPSTTAPGGRTTVTYAVMNQGDVEAGSCRINLYYSNMATVTQTAENLLGGSDLPALAAGATISGLTMDVVIPTTASQGMRYVGLVVDSDGVVDESNENDNIRSVSVTLVQPPDLRVSLNAPTPASQQYGGFIDLPFTVINGAPGPAGLFKTRFYYSDDMVIDLADTPMDYEWETSLAGNSSSDAQIAHVRIPSSAAPGTRYVGAIVDPDNEVFEGTGATPDPEANNTRAVPVTVTMAVCYGTAASDYAVCGGHGTCVGPDMCECADGWAGDECGDVAVVEHEPDAVVVWDGATFDDAGDDVVLMDYGPGDIGPDQGMPVEVGLTDVAVPDPGTNVDVIETDAASTDDGGETDDGGGCGQSRGTAWPVGAALAVMAAALAFARRRTGVDA